MIEEFQKKFLLFKGNAEQDYFSVFFIKWMTFQTDRLLKHLQTFSFSYFQSLTISS